jgi:phosphoribosylanthranilate isomerase
LPSISGKSISASRRGRRELVSSSPSIVSSECPDSNNLKRYRFPRGVARFDISGVSCDGTGMPTEVKICGLSDEEGVDAALAAGADFVGFVLFPPSPRNVTLERAAVLAARARGRVQIVAVTVGADDTLLAAIGATLRPDLLQLHGKESPERVSAIRAATGVPVMKALGVASRGDLATVADYRADRLLLDAKPPRDATRPGGHGMAFDWTLLQDFTRPEPWFLSGGLAPEEVGAALQATHAPGVDVSSGVERAPGRKDPDRIHAFVHAVRAFDRRVREAAGGTDKDRAA